MPLDNKISNIIGTKLPQWLLKQLEVRSRKGSSESRDNDNILFIANKSAWIRLVSSIDVTSQEDLVYFRRMTSESDNLTPNSTILDQTSLAKNYILFGGTSKYINKNSYQLRAGFGKDNAYGILGDSEIKEFGYRPMPGITSVTVETQGRLGSIRAAVIDFKCWDKNQLDIIDALYFKLGYTMFLEWGHTYFYPSKGNTQNLDPDKIVSTELYSIDPFEEGLTKEEINIKIAKNSRDTEGNYDAMLGIVTNFSFTYNQEGGYDCQLRLMGLGVLGDSIKINNAGTLPSLLEEEIVKLNKLLAELDYARQLKEYNEQLKRFGGGGTGTAATTTAATQSAALSSEDFFKTYVKYYPDQQVKFVAAGATVQGAGATTGFNTAAQTPVNIPGQISVSSRSTETYETIDAVFWTPAYGWVYFIRDRKGFIPIDSKYLPSVEATIDVPRLFTALENSSKGEIKGIQDSRIWTYPENYLENVKEVIKRPITALSKAVNAVVSWFSDDDVTQPKEQSRGTGNTELDKLNDTRRFVSNFAAKNGKTYTTTLVAKLWAYSDRTDIFDSNSRTKDRTFSNLSFTYVDTSAFVAAFGSTLSQPNFRAKIKSVQHQSNVITTTFAFKLPITVKAKIAVPGTTSPDIINNDGTVTKGKTTGESTRDEDVIYNLDVELSFTDSAYITGWTLPPEIKPPKEFIPLKPIQTEAPPATTPVASTGGSTSTGPTPPTKPDIKAIASQVKQSLNYQSTLEIMLRTIQVHALNKAINKTGKADLDIGKTTYVLDLYDKKDKVNAVDVNNKNTKSTFLDQIFSTGVFSTFINQLVENTIDDSIYTTEQKMNPLERFKIQAKYGFATSLMGNKESVNLLEPVNFQELLKAFVVPYQVNQEIIKGTFANHPVYIPLGLLLMILNHACTIYDTKKDLTFQSPLVYLDFNPELNFCLTNKKQLSTDPWTCLIPFEGSFEDFKSLFDSTILIKEGTAIQNTSNSKETVKLFNPETQDLLSGTLPKLKFDEQPAVNQPNKESGNVYRAKMMNILLNIDYLVQLAQQYSQKDGTNSVYLKTFLEQILSDVNKSLGNFNALRLSYNDSSNTFQIVDDQVTPTLSNEAEVTPKDNTTELPLVGKWSIAKSIEIKTEMSSKLSNMMAISANSTPENKATLSTNGDSVGFINTNYVDRYISDRLEITGSSETSKTNNDALKISAGQFNNAIADFYSKINPSQTSVGHATNYYIEKMTLIKNNDYPTRASFMIPLSINFSTDGIAGMSMGHAFTVSDKLLPYTYSTRKTTGFSKERVNNVGFVIVGLSHTIQNNQWNTSVKGNMIFLKDKGEFKGDIVRVEKRTGTFGVNSQNFASSEGGSTTYISGGGSAGAIIAGEVKKETTDLTVLAGIVIDKLEGGYYNPQMQTERPEYFKRMGKSGETLFGIDREHGGRSNESADGKEFWKLVDENSGWATNAASKWAYLYRPTGEIGTKLLNLAIKINLDRNKIYYDAYVKDPGFRAVIESDGRLLFNFVRASWNGVGYYKEFSLALKKAYDAGTTNSEDLLKLFIDLRLNTRLFWPNTDDNSFDLMRGGGIKIAKIVGVTINETA